MDPGLKRANVLIINICLPEGESKGPGTVPGWLKRNRPHLPYIKSAKRVY